MLNEQNEGVGLGANINKTIILTKETMSQDMVIEGQTKEITYLGQNISVAETMSDEMVIERQTKEIKLIWGKT